MIISSICACAPVIYENDYGVHVDMIMSTLFFFLFM